MPSNKSGKKKFFLIPYCISIITIIPPMMKCKMRLKKFGRAHKHAISIPHLIPAAKTHAGSLSIKKKRLRNCSILSHKLCYSKNQKSNNKKAEDRGNLISLFVVRRNKINNFSHRRSVVWRHTCPKQLSPYFSRRNYPGRYHKNKGHYKNAERQGENDLFNQRPFREKKPSPHQSKKNQGESPKNHLPQISSYASL